ncbi:MAG: hypothetical protein ACUVRD_03920 [Bacteroidia bacterium]
MKGYWLAHMPWEAYRTLFSSQDLPFLAENFLKALPTTWGTVILEEKGRMQTLVPLGYRKVMGLYWLRQPLFVPYVSFLGWDLPASTYKRFSEQEKLFTHFIEALPKNLLGFAYAWAPEWDFWLTASWKKFQVRPAGTYRILPSHAWKPAYLTQRILKKKPNVEFVRLSQKEARDFYHAHPPFPTALHKARKFFWNLIPFLSHWAVQAQEQITLVASFAENTQGIWYVASSPSPVALEENHLTHLFAYLIEVNRQAGRFFDFEGSWLKNVEFFFRRFGGDWFAYYVWRKGFI